MGGRSNVLETPFVELLGHLITNLTEAENEAKREQMQYYLDFIAMLNSNTPQSKEEARRLNKFINAIKPQEERKAKLNKKPKWNKRVQEKIEARARMEANNLQND